MAAGQFGGIESSRVQAFSKFQFVMCFRGWATILLSPLVWPPLCTGACTWNDRDFLEVSLRARPSFGRLRAFKARRVRGGNSDS